MEEQLQEGNTRLERPMISVTGWIIRHCTGRFQEYHSQHADFQITQLPSSTVVRNQIFNAVFFLSEILNKYLSIISHEQQHIFSILLSYANYHPSQRLSISTGCIFHLIQKRNLDFEHDIQLILRRTDKHFFLESNKKGMLNLS